MDIYYQNGTIISLIINSKKVNAFHYINDSYLRLHLIYLKNKHFIIDPISVDDEIDVTISKGNI